VDGTSGADFGQRATFTLPGRQLLQVRDSVIQEAARLLRARVGDEVQLRELQAETSSPEAWALVQRGTDIRRNGEASFAAGNAAAALAAIREADSVLTDAEDADARWAEVAIQRGQVALLASRAMTEKRDRAARLRDGLGHAARALTLDPSNATALALRGTLRYQLWRLNLESDAARQQQLLDSAQADLETAVNNDPTLASAHATLSQLYYFPPKEDLVAVVLQARAAYESDAYLRDAEVILDRLFFASYDLAQFQEARRTCTEGARRFPQSVRFVDCELWLLLVPGTEPDIAHAWSLVARADSMTAAPELPIRSRLRLIIIGGAIGRAGLRDSANHIFDRARTSDPAIDPEQELPGYEGMARAQMGDNDGAIALLRRYVATHPQHSFKRGGALHWWWRGLESHPQFRDVLRATR